MGHIRNTHAKHKKGLHRHIDKLKGRKQRKDTGGRHKRVKKA